MSEQPDRPEAAPAAPEAVDEPAMYEPGDAERRGLGDIGQYSEAGNGMPTDVGEREQEERP